MVIDKRTSQWSFKQGETSNNQSIQYYAIIQVIEMENKFNIEHINVHT